MESHNCPKCRSVKTVWRGYRYNERTKKRMRLCRHCGSKFTPGRRFWRMRFSEREILKAVGLYKKGYSSSEVVKTLRRDGIKVSRWSVLLWARKYGGLKGKG